MRVLLAQRQHHTHRQFLRLLAAEGHDVTVCSDASACLTEIENASFQLIVVDRQLPDMDGLSLVQAIRSSATCANAYLVVVTRADSTDELAQITIVDADDYIVLPASPESIQLRMRLVLRGAKRARRHLSTLLTSPVGSMPDLFSILPEAVFVLGEDGRIIAANQMLTTLTDYSQDELVGMPATYLGLPAALTPSVLWRQPNSLNLNGRSSQTEHMLIRKDRAEVRIELSTVPLRLHDRESLLGIVREITERERRVKTETDRLVHTLTSKRSDLVMALDGAGEIISISSQLSTLLGYRAAALRSTHIRTLVHRDDIRSLHHCVNLDLESPGGQFGLFRLRSRDGAWRSVKMFGKYLNDPPGDGAMLLIIQAGESTPSAGSNGDASVSRDTDSLTNLDDRNSFLKQLDSTLSQCDRERAVLTVFFIDLDRFKNINESFGYGAGDQILLDVAYRLRAHVRAGDSLARIGGDEFAILADGVHNRQGAVRIAEQIIEEFRSRPFEIGSDEILVTPSIGIALGASNGDRAADLLRRADIAMSQAKQSRSSHYSLYDPTMESQAKERLGLEIDLHRAFDRKQFRVLYQPEVDLTDGRVIGLEALIRWEHPYRGLILPGAFIKTAGEMGLIQALNIWVLEEACSQLVEWMAEHKLDTSFTIGVNFSASQFRQNDIAHQIGLILNETSLSTHNLRIEITEHDLLEDGEDVVQALFKLKKLGVQLAIDDFGMGYSSLSHLQCLPADILKIDRSFVSGAADGAGRLSITQSVASIARTFGMDVVVEGIETAEQLARVRACGCQRGQGFYFSRPVTAENIELVLCAGPRPYAHQVNALQAGQFSDAR